MPLELEQLLLAVAIGCTAMLSRQPPVVPHWDGAAVLAYIERVGAAMPCADGDVQSCIIPMPIP
jgi:hypothetical protein